MKLNPHLKVVLMAFAGAAVPTLGPLVYDVLAGVPSPGWRAIMARAIMGGFSAAGPYVLTSPYNTKLGPNVVANTSDLDKETQTAAGK